MVFVVINATHRLPVRTVMLLSSLRKRARRIITINWQRSGAVHEEHSHAVDLTRNIKTKNIFIFLCKAVLFLMKMRFSCVITDDIRFLPPAIVVAWFKKSKLLYNYREFPAATCVQRLGRLARGRQQPLMHIFQRLEAVLLSLAQGVLSIPLIFSGANGVTKHKNCRIINNVPSRREIADKETLEYYRKKYGGLLPVVFTGNMLREKGIEKYLALLPELRKRFTNVILIMAGHGAANVNLPHSCRDGVELLEHIPYVKMLGLLSVARVGLALYDPENIKFRNLDTGASRKLFTYMSCGLPAVSSRLPLSAVLEQEACGLVVDYHKPRELYNACVRLLSDDRLWNQCSSNALKSVREKYNWEREEEKIFEVLDNL